MLEIEAVRGGYGPINVLDDVSLHVASGEAVALLGPNGAGKSTLLGALTGTIPCRSGRVVFEGRNLAQMPSHHIFAAGLVLVPEGRQIFTPYTVLDNLRLGALSASRQSRSERLEDVFRLFPRLKERRAQIAGTLSGGEQQMLAIGRALMSKPRLLLLDEPFLGLAPVVVNEIRLALKMLRDEGLTTLLVEQKIDMALEMTSRAYVMIKGRIALHERCSALAGRDTLRAIYFSHAADRADPRDAKS